MVNGVEESGLVGEPRWFMAAAVVTAISLAMLGFVIARAVNVFS